MRRIYRKIAREHGVSVEEVKRDMQSAITYAYEHTPDDGITSAYQEQVPRKDEIPTIEEYIRHAARKARGQLKKKAAAPHNENK